MDNASWEESDNVRIFPGPGGQKELSSIEENDSLALALEFLSRYFGNSRPSAAITGDLPRVNGQLTLSGFIQGAERIHLQTDLRTVAVEEIPSLALPVVLLLKNGQACLLVKSEGTALTVVGPDFSEGIRTVFLEAISEAYSGRAVYVRPRLQFDEAQAELNISPTKSWLLATLISDWKIYAQAALATTIVNLFALVLPFFTSIVFDRVVPHQAMDTLHVLTIGVVTMIAFDFIIRTMRAHFLDMAGRRTDVLLSSRVLKQVLSLKMGASKRSSGDMANTLREFDSVREFFTSATLTAISDLPFAILFIIIIGAIAGPIALVPVVGFVVLLILNFAVVMPLDALVRKNYALGGQRNGLLFELLGNLETIKSIRGESWAQRQWEALAGHGALIGFKMRSLTQLTTHVTTLVYVLCPIATLVMGVYMLRDNSLTTGSLFAVVMLNGRVLTPLGQMTALLSRLRHVLVSLRSVDALMKAPTERPAGKTMLYPSQFKGGVEFRNVQFAYPGRDQDAITGVSFTVKPGERVAIIGRTGSGKSTIARMMLNLYEPKTGTVLVDQVDVRQIDPVALRRAVGYAPQDNALFSGSIRENIAVGAPWMSPEHIVEIASVAGLQTFIAESAEGLDRRVGERGEGLSGGQRQAICVARALIMDPKIVVLDEPTSMMDTAGEQMLKASLNRWLGSRTLILITHRLSLLSMVSRIIVVEGGRVVADGPRDNIIQHLRTANAAIAQ